MQTHQIYVLIFLILCAASLYWIGYRCGQSDSRAQEKLAEELADATALAEVKQSLLLARHLNRRMRAHCDTVDARCRMGSPERQTLIDVAAKLSLAAQTFQALPADRSQVHETLTLRDKTLAIAKLLAPAEMEDAA